MPLDRNQFGRLRVIHNNLSMNQRLTISELSTACQIELSLPQAPSERTMKYDFHRLRNSFNAPLANKGGKYFYTDDYSLFDVLNPEELRFAKEMNAMLGQLAQLPLLKGFESFQLKIRQRVGDVDSELIQFDQVDQYLGKDHLPELYNALREKRCLKITYQDFHGVVSQHTISPYVLKEYNNRWYLFGWEHVQNQLFNLALDRIQKIENSDFGFLPDRKNVATHLSDMVGVTRSSGAEPQEVLIRVKKPRAYYLKTKPLHKSQQIQFDQETQESMVFKYFLILNKELTSTLLSLGTDAEVLAPAGLRKEVADCVKAMWEGYQ
jgi:predicted DNA-binding transcriptional regulator YafY